MLWRFLRCRLAAFGWLPRVVVDQGGEFAVRADVAAVERAQRGGCQPEGEFEQVVDVGAVPVGEAGELVEDADGAAVGGGGHPDLGHRGLFGGDEVGGGVVVDISRPLLGFSVPILALITLQ